MSTCRLILLSLTTLSLSAFSAPPEPLDFNRDIRPILSENCFFCHGQDPKNREADLRLDQSEGATRDLGGYFAIVPGEPEKSEILARLKSHDRDEMMPPPKSNRKVDSGQIALIERWIKEGAPYAKHWAFIPPVKAARVLNDSHPIDSLVERMLQKNGLVFSPEARPEIWLRRASFDITGLAPTPAEVDTFLTDIRQHGEAAYGSAADRLLASPRFGERQAVEWLDIARYADTHGFNNDSARSMWRWRDWVIAAFNDNLPYDRFITEQLAGDLLPHPTLEQRIATGFGRNHVINSEGGIIDEEYRVEYVADRVRTTSLAWLGLTMECARCHDHKFDPITQTDYYRLFAFFNNVAEHGEDGRIANAVPLIQAPTAAQSRELADQEERLHSMDRDLATMIADDAFSPSDSSIVYRLSDEAAKRSASLPAAFVSDRSEIASVGWRALRSGGPGAPATLEGKLLDCTGKEGVSASLWIKPDRDNAADVPLLSNQSYTGSKADQGYGKGQELRLIDGEIEIRVSARFPAYALRVRSVGANILPDVWRHIAFSFTGNNAGGVRLFADGRELVTLPLYDGLTGSGTNATYLIGADGSDGKERFHGTIDSLRTFNKATSSSEVRDLFIAEALPYASARALNGTIDSTQRGWLTNAVFATKNAKFRELLTERDALWEKHLALRRALPTTMVMQEMAERRPTFVLKRGQYDSHGDLVEPGVPESLLAPWPKDAPRNRLGLAQWLTQPQHPLTSRVVVNRFWAQFFGTGIVKSVEDFGSQGEYPVHVELLDWLAREFIESGWNVKGLFREIVLSRTYRQDSAGTPELLTRDPENRLLARGPRVRFNAETIRDHALAISGLLKEKSGGPSVYPYQPAKLYDGVVVGADYPGTKWVESTGDDLFRRSLYIFWKRTVPYPGMLTFDAPDREFCTARRSRTNTPLQALVLLNDPTYLEAARHLAEVTWREIQGSDTDRLAEMFRRAVGRTPLPAEVEVLTGFLEKLRTSFSKDEKAAAAFLKTGTTQVPADLPVTEHAAAAAVASMILNLDETITKY